MTPPNDPPSNDPSSASGDAPDSQAENPSRAAGDAEPEAKSGGRRWSELGGALGGFVRRVGAMVEEFTEAGPRVPEDLREPLADVDDAWAREDFAGAVARLAAITGDAGKTFVRSAEFLIGAHAELVGAAPVEGLSLPDPLPDAPSPQLRLWLAARHLQRNDPARARDELRRAQQKREQVPRRHLATFERMHAMVLATAWRREGELDKAARALDEAREELAGIPARLRERLVVDAIELWLSLDRLEEAELASAALVEDDDQVAAPLLAIRARVLAARGQLEAARALRKRAGAAVDEANAVRLSLALDPPAEAEATALRWLQGAPEESRRLRAWALARLGRAAGRELDAPSRRAVADALAAGLNDARGRPLRELQRELAFISLRQGDLSMADRPKLREAATAAGAAPELRLWSLRRRAAAGEALGDEMERLHPPRPRVASDPAGPAGPDEISPLRDAALRSRVIESQRALIAGEWLRRQGDLEAANDAFVDALVDDPELEAARDALAQRRPYPRDGRLEHLLAAITERLGALPQRVGGLPLEDLPEALEASIAARERLARPLTIAIMGEFSAGKSTFVNAWLGRSLAPMGALPTTCTINVFRRGGSGHARIHRRDGRVEQVDASQVAAYLGGLDEVAAAEIRHVEIERGDAGRGDATLVDTPGLNALDPYHEQVAREFIAEADAVVWIFSATRGAGDSERDLLDELREDGRRVLGVLNKADILSPAERDEMSSYLRGRLGEVLVEVVPMSAKAALEQREEADDGEDPGEAVSEGDLMQPVEAALETHFLANARELKAEVVRRRVREALGAALVGVEAAAERLEARSALVPAPDIVEIRAWLRKSEATIAKAFGELDAPLMRELLGLGIIEVSEGLRSGRPSERDLRYLSTRLQGLASETLREAWLALDGHDTFAADELAELHLQPWLRGYLRATAERGGLRRWIDAAAAGAKNGEAAIRTALREELDLLSAALGRELRGLDRRVRAKVEAQYRHRGGQPRAQALRLRAVVRATLQSAIEALEGADLETARED